MGAGWQAHRRLVSRSHLDDDARRPAGQALTAADSTAIEREPAWSPDGTRIAYAADRGERLRHLRRLAEERRRHRRAHRGDDHGGRRALAVVDARRPPGVRASRLAPPGRAADPSLQWDLFIIVARERVRHVAGPGAAHRHARQRDLPARVARRRPRSPSCPSATPKTTSTSGGCRCRTSASPSRRRSARVRRARRRPRSRRCDGTPLRATRVAKRARQRGVSVVGARQPAPRVLRRARRHRLGVGGHRRARASGRRRGSAAAGEAVGAAAARVAPGRRARRGRRTAARCSSPGLPDPQPVYNGNPLRNEAEAPPLFALNAAFQLWRVAAPLPVHDSGGEVAVAAPLAPLPRSSTATFDRVWDTLRRSTTRTGASRDAVDRRPRQVPPRGRGREEREASRSGDRRAGGRAAADQAGRHLEGRGGRLGPSARVRSRPAARSRRAATSSTR